MIDLRSDTVTKPTPEMMEAMQRAPVGDDVFSEDPSINELEEKVASIFGKEAALFCASGTMTNQIAIKVNTSPQDEVICDHNAHIYRYEGGGMMSNSLVSVRLLNGDRGRITAEQVLENISPDDDHAAKTSLVSVENTMNKGGGACYDLKEVKKIKQVCDEHDLRFHLDGARLFNALTAKNEDPKAWGSIFDTISVCFSKGLGAPVGSAVLGTKADIKQAKRVRKAFGGGWRQAGYLAAACIYALDNHVDRLHEDHAKALVLANALKDKSFIDDILSIETNIVIASCDGISPQDLVAKMGEKGILCFPFSKTEFRMVTHLEITDEKLDAAVDIINNLEI